MFVEKYLIIGIKYPKDVITDLTRKNIFDKTNIIDPITITRESRNEIFVDNFYTCNTKSEAFARLNIIQGNIPDIMFWSILPIVVDISVEEARRLKLSKLIKKLKRK